MYNPLLVKGVENFERKIEDYAKLLLLEGVNFHEGQSLVIDCPTSAPELARACVHQAYKLGAKDVEVVWYDHYVDRDRYSNNKPEDLNYIPTWPELAKNQYGKDLAFIVIQSYNSDFFEDLSDERKTYYNNRTSTEYESFKKGLEYPYTICAAAGPEWAKKVFPDKTEEEAYVELWNKIFDTVYVDGKSDVCKNWQEGSKKCAHVSQILNGEQLDHLHVTTELGTDVEIGLPKDHIWVVSAINKSADGVYFSANMPTEEIFCVPEKTKVNGTIVPSRPMVGKACIVHDAKLEIKDGAIVKMTASKGAESLQYLMDNNENGNYLGEIAIVPYNTPISKSGLTYFNSLLDENAGCHMAIGNAYSKCIKGGLQMTPEELAAAGLNVCTHHIDFVFGTPKTKIVGYKQNGDELLIMENGEFKI